MLYLSPYQGDGTRANPFRPIVTDAGWSAIDIRPDPAVVTGFCLLHLPGTSANTELREIGTTQDEVIGAVRLALLATRLGINLDLVVTAQDLVVQLLQDKLVPTSTGMREIIFDNQAWYRDAVTPPRRLTPEDPSDDFNRANENPLAGNWTKGTGAGHNFQLISNALGGITTADQSWYYWNANTPATANQFSELTVTTLGTRDYGPACRMSTSAETFYIGTDQSTGVEMYKAVAGTYTQLGASSTPALSVNDVLRMEAEGTSVRVLVNSAVRMSTTDTSITAANRWGIYMFQIDPRLDTWNAGEFSGGAFVNAGAEGAVASGNVTLGAPASPITNDIWIATIHSRDQVAHSIATDWTQIFQANGGGTTSRLSVWYFRYAGSTPALVWTHTAGDNCIGGISAWRGLKTTGSPVDATGLGTGGAGTDASIEITGVTPTVANCMLLSIDGAGDDNARSTLPTGFANCFVDAATRAYVSTLGLDGSVATHFRKWTTGATGNFVDTMVAADPWASVLIALEPASAGPAVSLPAVNPRLVYQHLITR